jgi:hypothetical protein
MITKHTMVQAETGAKKKMEINTAYLGFSTDTLKKMPATLSTIQ